jgi:hypothetical protein
MAVQQKNKINGFLAVQQKNNLMVLSPFLWK